MTPCRFLKQQDRQFSGQASLCLTSMVIEAAGAVSYPALYGGVIDMKGYNTQNGYMGFVNGRYILFCSESEYVELMQEDDTAEASAELVA